MNSYKYKLTDILKKIDNAKHLSKYNETVKLIAVSKMVSSHEVQNLFDEGQIAFGENKVQSLKEKHERLSNLKIDWHFIGRLQTNKINQLLSLRPTLMQSCDSFELAQEIDKRVKDFKPDILLQINSANESTKAGVSPKDAIEVYKKIKLLCKNINICGVMSIGAHTDDVKIIQKSFEITRDIFDELKEDGAKYCSMGMSGDYELAIKCGSNMIRLGSILFKSYMQEGLSI